MLFFKQKQKTDELLPPPPPYSDLELEQEIKEKPKFFDEIIKPKKSEPIPEEEEFGKLVKEVEGLKPKKTLRKSVKAAPKKISKAKKQIMPVKIKPIQLKKVRVQELKEEARKQKIPAKAPKQLKKVEIKKLKEKAKPKEILEAQEEIKSAIDKIKKKERPSFLGRLFERKEKEKQEESYPTFSIPNGDGLSIIQSSIKKARDALMRFDLETAKRNYIEIMRLYNNLSPQNKAKVYNDINELYYERKNAEEL